MFDQRNTLVYMYMYMITLHVGRSSKNILIIIPVISIMHHRSWKFLSPENIHNMCLEKDFKNYDNRFFTSRKFEIIITIQYSEAYMYMYMYTCMYMAGNVI